MTPRRHGTAVRAKRAPVIVLAGEDENDRACLKIVLEELCPDMRGRLVEIRDSVRLRAATGKTLAARVAVLAKKARVRAERQRAELACVFVHEDFDAVDSDGYRAVRDRVAKALADELGNAHYVLAVEEVEAWLLLFPDALTGFAKGWQVPNKYRNRNTGMIGDPKGVLAREVSRGGYREDHARAVLEKVVQGGGLENVSGSNRSWDLLCTDAKECAAGHLVPQQRARSGRR